MLSLDRGCMRKGIDVGLKARALRAQLCRDTYWVLSDHMSSIAIGRGAPACEVDGLAPKERRLADMESGG